MTELMCENGWVVRRAGASRGAAVYGLDWDGRLVLMATGPLADCLRAAGLRHHDTMTPDAREAHIRRAVDA